MLASPLAAGLAHAQDLTLQVGGQPRTFKVRTIDSEAFISLDEFAAATGVPMERDDVFHQVTLAPETPGEIALMPGFKSVRHAGKIVTWKVAPVEVDGKIWAPADMVRDLIWPAVAASSGAAESTAPTPEPTITPWPGLGPTPLPTRGMNVFFPEDAVTSPTDEPTYALETPTPASMALAETSPFPGVPETIPSTSFIGVKTVFIDPCPVGEEGKRFLAEVAPNLNRQLQEKARINVVFTQDRDGLRPSDVEIAAQANSVNAGLFLSIQARMSERSTDYVIFYHQPAAGPGARALNPLQPDFGIPWGAPDARLTEQSLSFAKTLNGHLTHLLGRKGKGVRPGRFEVLEGARMPAVVVDIRPDALFAADAGAAQKITDAIVFTLMDAKNRLEGLPLISHY